ncbi:hypothetical protein XBP1_2810030 [Xenorhabdus bovienii str. puntauvense]|uniref:Uncharacterized protein n=2 Tax=Xenorhabdus bovienii TaxID=40576 RepID=A0A077NIT0_XENBV|nr:hypothetical protein XBP1_2810030 [Xenorhabdus bovienii str. puntauvense]CDH00573.1 hypothetical protein XBFM1_1720006 [Xenorhabdus bovienii str. feltiae Moldova]
MVMSYMFIKFINYEVAMYYINDLTKKIQYYLLNLIRMCRYS